MFISYSASTFETQLVPLYSTKSFDLAEWKMLKTEAALTFESV